jgi:hypothetical protein
MPTLRRYSIGTDDALLVLLLDFAGAAAKQRNWMDAAARAYGDDAAVGRTCRRRALPLRSDERRIKRSIMTVLLREINTKNGKNLGVAIPVYLPL